MKEKRFQKRKRNSKSKYLEFRKVKLGIQKFEKPGDIINGQ